MSDPDPIVVFETNQGVIEIQLMPMVAPKACQNLMEHVRNGYYDGLIFHRVIPKFMVQGGDPTGSGSGGQSIWGESFEDECSKKVKFNQKGLLAMANSGPNTNGSQFFITTAKTHWLHMKHTIFGTVIDGFNTVKKIENAPADGQDRPKIPQKIIRAFMKTSPAND